MARKISLIAVLAIFFSFAYSQDEPVKAEPVPDPVTFESQQSVTINGKAITVDAVTGT